MPLEEILFQILLGFEFISALLGLVTNAILFRLIQQRKPFTENVRFLFSCYSVCNCITSLYSICKDSTAIATFQFSDFSANLPNSMCILVSVVLHHTPGQLTVFLIWIVVAERFYTSLKFIQKSELSKRTLIVLTLASAIIIGCNMIFYFSMLDDQSIPKMISYCDVVLFVHARMTVICFLIYVLGQTIVLWLLIWMKRNSLKQIENFVVNHAQSNLANRFQYKKTLEVTRALLPCVIA